MSYITSNVERAEFGHAWHAKDGSVNATVRLGPSFITFDDPAAARAAAAACLRAADAMEALPPAQDGGAVDGGQQR